MQLILLIIAIGIAAAVSFLTHPQRNNSEKILSVETEVQQNIKNPTSTPIEENNAQDPSVISTPTPANTSEPTKTESGEFIYPNSKNTGGENYESTDDPDIITNWYKEKIKSKNMNVKNFVTTKANGSVLNKLAGSTSNFNIQIEIQKNEGDNTTKIKISE